MEDTYLLLFAEESLEEVIRAVDPTTWGQVGDSIRPAWSAVGSAGKVLTGPDLARYNWPLMAGAGVSLGSAVPLAISPDGERAVVNSPGSTLCRVISTETGVDLEQLSWYGQRAWFDPTGRYVILFERQVRRALCDTATGLVTELPWLGNGYTAPKFGPTGKWFYAVAASDPTWEYPVMEFSVEDPLTPVRAVTAPTYSQSAMVVCVTPTRIVTAGGGSARVFDAGTGAELAVIDEGYDEEENWVVSPDGRFILAYEPISGSGSNSARIYSVDDGSLVGQFTGHFKRVEAWVSMVTPPVPPFWTNFVRTTETL